MAMSYAQKRTARVNAVLAARAEVKDPLFPRYVVSVRFPKFGWQHVGAHYSEVDAVECMKMWIAKHEGEYSATVTVASATVAQCWDVIASLDGTHQYK